MKNGEGVMTYVESGLRYEGTWANGSYSGRGTMTRNGDIVASGDWTNCIWDEGEWGDPYPREGGRGTMVKAWKSTGGPAPRRLLR